MIEPAGRDGWIGEGLHRVDNSCFRAQGGGGEREQREEDGGEGKGTGQWWREEREGD